MARGRTTSRGVKPPSESTGTSRLVNPDAVEVIRPEAIEYGENLIAQTLKEVAAEYQAALKTKRRGKSKK